MYPTRKGSSKAPFFLTAAALSTAAVGSLAVLLITGARSTHPQPVDDRVYLLATLAVHNPEWVQPYMSEVSTLIQEHGGRMLARTREVERLEGDSEAPEAMVIIEWPSEQAAREFYHSPEYRPHRDARMAGATTQLLLVRPN